MLSDEYIDKYHEVRGHYDKVHNLFNSCVNGQYKNIPCIICDDIEYVNSEKLYCIIYNICEFMLVKVDCECLHKTNI